MPVSIGRRPPMMLCFPEDETLADDPATLVYTGKRWYVEATRPENEVFVDGERLGNCSRLLPSGSTVRCGRQAPRIVHWEKGTEYFGSQAGAVDVGIRVRARENVRSALEGFLKTRVG